MRSAQESDGSHHGSVNSGSTTLAQRKRQRDEAEEASVPPCAQCRSRKVRCDRQRPDCSNCRRAGVPCEYSNSSSTAYNVKELFDAFSSVTSRLDRMEETLAGIAHYIKYITPTAGGLQSPPTTDGVHSHSQDAGDVAPPVESTAACVIPDEDDERVPGDPASIALFKSLRNRLKSAVEGPSSEPTTLWALAAKDPAVKRVLERQLELFPFNGGCLDFPVSSNTQPMQAPPRYILEDCLRSSFTELHVFASVFQKQYLEDAVAFYYDSPPCQQSQAQVLMMNNIYLLAITLQARAYRARQAGSKGTYLNLEVAYALLGNCDRALQNLGAFNNPTVENVRALLSLAFVCQEYYSVPVQIRVSQATARLTRAVGLQKWHAPSNGSWDNLSEDERLFWLIYTMDKQLAFQGGQAGGLYLHDCTLPLYPCGTGTPTIEQVHGAFTSLSTIWEEIYSSLYSVRSSIIDDFARNTHVRRLHSILSVWKEAYEPLFTSWTLPDLSHLKHIQTELQYAFLTTNLLIQRCNTTLPPSERYREFAEPALKLLTTNFDTLSPSECTTLGRIFRNYPLIAFHDFFLYTLLSEGAGLAENTELLQAATRLLEPFRDADFPESFYNKLYSGFTWCTNQLDILLEVCHQRASLTGGICPELDEMANPLSGLAPRLGV